MLAAHWIPHHRGTFGRYQDAQVLRDWGPAFVKLVWDGSRPPYLEDIPGTAKIIWRNYPLSEQFHGGLALANTPQIVALEDGTLGLAQNGSGRDVGAASLPQNGSGRDLRALVDHAPLRAALAASDLATPEQAAEVYVRNALEVADYCASQGIAKNRLLFEGPNEYPVWAHGYTGLARMEAARLRGLHAAGLAGVAVNLGVGWPGNLGTDLPPVWDWARIVINEMRNGDYLGLHEYWAWNGPRENWRWWAGRLLQCPHRVPILVTEAGVDGGVLGQVTAKKGWLDLPGDSVEARADRYLNELWEYCALLRGDGRTQGVFIYTYDGNRNDWGRFDIRHEALVERLLARIRAGGLPAVGQTPTPGQPAPELLPEHEPVAALKILADKIRWWMEESVRQDEAGNGLRAQAIRYSLINRDAGLLYRLENALKRGQAVG